MKFNNNNAPFYRHKSMVIVLIICLLGFPVVSILSSLNNVNIDFVELHDEKNTSDQEKLEENSKNEKKELPIANFNVENYHGSKTINNYGLQSLKLDFILEIPIPPPDFA